MPALPLADGGPDEFGYTWDDAAAFNWIDAATGTDRYLVGNDLYSQIEIGFPFKFYENTYTDLYINTNGLITFGGTHPAYANRLIPQQAAPNNLIAAFWDDLAINQSYNSGKVYTLLGGAAPDRFLVIEYAGISRCCAASSAETLTFEIILYENGDILLQYLSLAGNLQSASVGIEDASGLSGLTYLHNSAGLADGKAVRFTRPAAAARLQVNPPVQGTFVRAGETRDFSLTIRNTGDTGADVFDLATSSVWPFNLFYADGVTPLSDSDSDTIIDTGWLSPGSALTFIARLQTPSGAAAGDANAAAILAQSSLNPAKNKTITLQTAVPAPFALAFSDDADGVMKLFLSQPAGQAVRPVNDLWTWGYEPAVTQTPDGSFLYLWDRWRCVDAACALSTSEIEYALLDKVGLPLRPASRLTDHSAAGLSTYDYSAVAAVTPDGHIGVLWYREVAQSINGEMQSNFNVHFAILDASGSLIYGPANLTSNTYWGTAATPNVPQYYSTRLAATTDNRFVLAWQRYHHAPNCAFNDCKINDIYVAVVDASGGAVSGPLQFTHDTIGDTWEGYDLSGVNALSGGNFLLTWQRASDGDLYYAVMDSAGNLIKNPARLTEDGWTYDDNYADAAELSDGKIVVAWTGSGITRFAVLDSSFTRTVAPTLLPAPAVSAGTRHVSVTADAAGHAVLTWMDADYSQRTHLYYALVNGGGGILTPAMIFRSGQAQSASLQTSATGFGSTTYNAIVPGVDMAIWPSTALALGTPGGAAPVEINYANYGLATPASITIAAILSADLTYAGDTSGVSPAVSGSVLTWELPGSAFLDSQSFLLFAAPSPAAPYGAHYPVTLTITTAETDAELANNTVLLEVMAAMLLYLPEIFN